MTTGEPMDVERLRAALSAGRFEWRQHSLQRMAERGIPQTAVLDVLQSGDFIENYPEDRPYPSGLVLGWVEEKPLHVLAALDQQNMGLYHHGL